MLRGKNVCSMFLLPYFIIGDSSSLRDLIWELDVIKGSKCTTTFTNWTQIVLIVIFTRDWNVLRSRMHNDWLLSRSWGWEVPFLLWRTIHKSDFIINIYAIAVLNDCCTWLPRLERLRHSLQSQALIILWLAIATLVRQLIVVLDKLRAATRWIGLSSSYSSQMISSCWCRELVHL